MYEIIMDRGDILVYVIKYYVLELGVRYLHTFFLLMLIQIMYQNIKAITTTMPLWKLKQFFMLALPAKRPKMRSVDDFFFWGGEKLDTSITEVVFSISLSLLSPAVSECKQIER
jgi:hypothetical protein